MGPPLTSSAWSSLTGKSSITDCWLFMSWLSCLFIIYISFKLNVNYLRALDCAHLPTSRGPAVSGLPQLADEHFGSHCLARPARAAFGLTSLLISERQIAQGFRLKVAFVVRCV